MALEKLTVGPHTQPDVHFLHLKEHTFPLEHHAKIGKVHVMYAAWGTPITADQYKQQLAAEGRLDSDTTAMIDNSGFNISWRFPDELDPFSDQFQEQQVRNGVALVERLVRGRSWNGIDILSVSSMTSKEDVHGEIVKRLRDKNIWVEAVMKREQACYGGFAPLVDFSRTDDPTYHGRRAVSISVESLTGNMIDANDPLVWWTFGNGGAGIAWIPGVEIQHIMGRTEIDPDTEGAMKILVPHAAYPDRLPNLPLGYEFVEGTSEDAKNMFYATRDGIYFDFPVSETGKITMDPKAALKAFVAPVVALKRAVRQEFVQQYQGEFGTPAETEIAHMPSYPVRFAQQREDNMADLISRGLSTGEARKFLKSPRDEQDYLLQTDSRLSGLTFPVFHWTLSDINNVSGGVALIDMTVKAEHGLIPLGVPVQANVYGIGVTRGSHYLIFNTH